MCLKTWLSKNSIGLFVFYSVVDVLAVLGFTTNRLLLQFELNVTGLKCETGKQELQIVVFLRMGFCVSILETHF